MKLFRVDLTYNPHSVSDTLQYKDLIEAYIEKMTEKLGGLIVAANTDEEIADYLFDYLRTSENFTFRADSFKYTITELSQVQTGPIIVSKQIEYGQVSPNYKNSVLKYVSKSNE
jgi:hypothetical protein